MSNQPRFNTPPRSNLLANSPLIIIVLLVVDSLHFVFARLLHPYLPGGTSAMYVLAIATVEVTVFMAIRRQIRFGVFWADIRFFLIIGLLVATATTFNYVAIGFIDPGTASLLAQTSILFALALGIFWLKERLASIQIAGALLAFVGVLIISFQPGEFTRLGSLLVLSSAFMYALHTAIVKRHGGGLDFGNFFLFRVAATTGFLILFTTVRGQLVWPSREAWLFLILAGTIDVVISRVLYYLALRRLQLSIHTVVLTLSPVITIFWSLLLFGERPTLLSIIGGAAVIAGIAVVSLSQSGMPLRAGAKS
jgi:drug/metabolite transporter (DMT)-like permease